MPRRLALLLRQTEGNASFLAECRAAVSYYNGGDFIDVGAHEGSYSLILAAKASPDARFYAFEPHLAYYRRLQANMAIIAGMYPNIRTASFCSAVGDGRGVEITFPMGENYHPQVRSSDADTGLKTVNLDSFVSVMDLQPGFVKIDVEGAEYFVLQGMKRTLSVHKPVVMLEFHPRFQPPGIALDACGTLMREAGYSIASTISDEVAERQFWLAGPSVARP
ncbi:MAG TPA: FkbM family methyltransferase [Candidatus Limnocylindria bacterium]|nr:FkbM family methyltransferase [Candidatus Limnocylindria bacterium]